MDFIKVIADNNAYHPAKDYLDKVYLENKDKVDVNNLVYLKELADTLITESNFPEKFKITLLRCWLISCIHAATQSSGFHSEGIIVLQGAQGSRKTSWFRSLVPDQALFSEGENLNPSDKDSVDKNTKFWIVEWGEIASTYKRDLDGLKAFITKKTDTFRESYGRYTKSFPRRTIFGGSVNEEKFLKDDTGDRRTWMIPLKKINTYNTKHRDLLWTEIYSFIKNNSNDSEKIRWWLTKEEEKELSELQTIHIVWTTKEDQVRAHFDWSKTPSRYKTVLEIYEEMNKPNVLGTHIIGQTFNKLKLESKQGRANVRYWFVPEKKDFNS